MGIEVDASMLSEAEKLNRRLAMLPRLSFRHRVVPLAAQALLRLSQPGADRRVRRAGLDVQRLRVRVGSDLVALRVLRPPGSLRGVVLDIHGGGWAFGNAAMNDRLNVATACACQVAVVSIDYRLVGRWPLGAQFIDCAAAAEWLLGHEATDFAGLPIVVVGESAGAHLAAILLQQLRDRHGRIEQLRGAVLYYGIYDLEGTPSVRAAGRHTLLFDGPALVSDLHRLTPDLDGMRQVHLVSPLYGRMDGLPPALLYAAALDPFIDDTLAMGHQWKRAAKVEVHVLPAAPHGFLRFRTAMSAAVQAHTHAWISQRLAP